MVNAAKDSYPQRIISHGDNFYWTGVQQNDVKQRFKDTFENVYHGSTLRDVKWISVLGNHDYGGSSFICGDSSKTLRACNSIEEMLYYLKRKFELQRDYDGPNHRHWYMPGHYFKDTLYDELNNVKIDIFNVEMNFADSHGAHQICCQCYGYSKAANGHGCGPVGHKFCMGGNAAMYNACYSQLEEWFEESLQRTLEDAKTSTADWKIVNSHFSPYNHMKSEKWQRWRKILVEGKIQLFMNGHNHGANHDYGEFDTHFLENGAGGGSMSSNSHNPPSNLHISSIWKGVSKPPLYGFYELSASKYWMRLRFFTFGDDWNFGGTSVAKGSNKVAHCWYMPVNGSKGQPC